jgi:hypothetical protein
MAEVAFGAGEVVPCEAIARRGLEGRAPSRRVHGPGVHESRMRRFTAPFCNDSRRLNRRGYTRKNPCVRQFTGAIASACENRRMDERAPVSSAVFHGILRRDFRLLRPPACKSCEIPKPRRGGDGDVWDCRIETCDFGCHRLLEWMVAQYRQQYRPRDLCDTLS